MNIFYHQRFKKVYAKLPFEIKLKAEKREVLFLANPFDVRLNTHKLHGKLKSKWSFSVDSRFRILFEFDKVDHSSVIFLDIGDHDLYQ